MCIRDSVSPPPTSASHTERNRFLSPSSTSCRQLKDVYKRQWQARYDLDLAPFGLPGLSFMARYVSGRAIDGSHAPVSYTHLLWNAALRLAYQPALKSAKRYSGAG